MTLSQPFNVTVREASAVTLEYDLNFDAPSHYVGDTAISSANYWVNSGQASLGAESGDSGYNSLAYIHATQEITPRRGDYCSKHYVEHGGGSASATHRVEIVPYGSGANYPLPNVEGDTREYWYGYALYHPTDRTGDGRWALCTQMHQSPDLVESWTNPSLGLYMNGGTWQWVNRWQNFNAGDPDPVDTNPDGTFSMPSEAYPVGQWIDIVIHAKWSNFSSGFLKIWHDGVLKVDRTGPNRMNNPDIGKFKCGLYKGWKANAATVGWESQTIYVDAFRMGLADNGVGYDDVFSGNP